MLFNKKAISPVVASALILVIAVVSVVSFQGWLSSYSSGVYSDAELDSGASSGGIVSGVSVESLIGNTLYIKSSQADNISTLKIGSNECVLGSTELEEGINEIDVSSCINDIQDGEAKDIFVLTEGAVTSSKTAVVHSGY